MRGDLKKHETRNNQAAIAASGATLGVQSQWLRRSLLDKEP
jgi:hypothetical protein